MKNQQPKLHLSSTSHNQSFTAQDWLAETANLTANSSLRILIVLSQQPTQTGSGVYMRELVEELQKLGHKPYLLAAHYRSLSTTDFPFLPDNQIYTMIFDNGENSDIAEIRFPIPGMSLDMPYLHLPFRELSPSMLEEYRNAWTSKLQDIAEKVRPHLIHINHLWLMAGITRSAVPWIPIVSTSHGSEFILLQDAPTFSSLIIPGVQSLDAVMASSTDTAREAVAQLGLHPGRVHIIGNGYNPSLFHIMNRERGDSILENFLSRYQTPSSRSKLVLYVGKFADYKGLPYLIHAAKKYSATRQNNVITLIIGEGSKKARSQLENLVESLGMKESVFLPGKLPYEEVGKIMNLADVFVLPSIYEGFGLVLLEALACGIRSVSTERGGPPFFVPQVLRDKGFVILIKPLSLLKGQQVDPSDVDRYITDLDTSISQQLAFPTSISERQAIADSVKNLTWASRVRDSIHVYLSAIRLRREVLVNSF
jgi:glycosyltransferase involved in cell wall biosynthesis